MPDDDMIHTGRLAAKDKAAEHRLARMKAAKAGRGKGKGRGKRGRKAARR